MRRGSALLIVLGMLAFMLFSGLAFSVYMRQSRLPTSFLRRTVATRQLAKAALAEAIEDIDLAIGNDPHPGVRKNGKTFDESELDNFWEHRVFSGYGTTTDPNSTTTGNSSSQSTTYYPAQADIDDTVPVLTLEGLAYVPPNLINEVRYYSQRTPTAQWHSFWFDSGRYAYVAVDVSDYFDVNRVFANKPRAACATQRISFAHVFEESKSEPHDTADTQGLGKAWDAFMKPYRLVDDNGQYTDSAEPLVSLADLNVVWSANGPSALPCPFSKYLNGDAKIYGTSEQGTDTLSEKYRCMSFVTDGYFPTPDGTTTTESQPFKYTDLNGSSMPTMQKFVSLSSPLSTYMSKLGLIQLWDYLDINRVPVSLSMPTLERVPMIVGTELSMLPTLKFTTSTSGSDTYENVTATSRTITRTYECKISSSGNYFASILAAYPFRNYGVTEQDDTFEIDGRVAIFLTVDGQTMTLRPGANNKALHLTKDNMQDGNRIDEKSVLSYVPSTKVTIKASDIAKNASVPVKKVDLHGDGSIAPTPFFQVTYTWQQTKSKNAGEGAFQPKDPNPPTNGTIVNDTAKTFASFFPLAANGGQASEFSTDFATKIANGISVKANAAIWLRVKYKDPDLGEKFVDLVPACLMDDKELNGVDMMGDSTMMQRFFGENYPLLRYDATMSQQPSVTVTARNFNQECALAITQAKSLVSDPRFNHAPENWYASGTGLSEQDWITAANELVGQGDCDGDFFLATSDQGYLQSIYELAFLPRFSTLEKKDGESGWGIAGSYNPSYGRTTLADKASDAMDSGYMWRTYRCFGGDESARFEEIELNCAEGGMKVNPYSDSTRVLMAAFANTPHDWRVASTNTEAGVLSDSEMKDATTFNKNHAWNGYCSKEKGRICWECFEEVAEAFSDAARQKGDWETAFRNLGWSSRKNRIIELMEDMEDSDSELYGVDKKFLYGFWHDCFSARQQLFLVFVRAEPMMMGGGVSGQAPPQLGSRAVALVWRDPTATSYPGNNGNGGTQRPNPHRSRILFYHPFD